MLIDKCNIRWTLTHIYKLIPDHVAGCNILYERLSLHCPLSWRQVIFECWLSLADLAGFPPPSAGGTNWPLCVAVKQSINQNWNIILLFECYFHAVSPKIKGVQTVHHKMLSGNLYALYLNWQYLALNFTSWCCTENDGSRGLCLFNHSTIERRGLWHWLARIRNFAMKIRLWYVMFCCWWFLSFLEIILLLKYFIFAKHVSKTVNEYSLLVPILSACRVGDWKHMQAEHCCWLTDLVKETLWGMYCVYLDAACRALLHCNNSIFNNNK